MSHLKTAQIEGLLGVYNPKIEISDELGLAIITGPNGVGKTKFLEILDLAYSFRLAELKGYPFSSLELTFSDGVYLRFENVRRSLSPMSLGPEEAAGMRVIYENGEGETLTWSESGKTFERWVSEHTPFVISGPNLWIDPRDGETLTTDDVKELFNWSDEEIGEAPMELQALFRGLSCRLIEAQRLRYSARPVSGQRGTLRRMSRSRPTEEPAVHYISRKIKERIMSAQEEQIKVTQALDKTFPGRVLKRMRSEADVSPYELLEGYREQLEFRDRLNSIVSGLEVEIVELPNDDLKSHEKLLLSLYIEDGMSKLRPFEDLLSRIDLFEEVINNRLVGKSVRVSSAKGIQVTLDDEGGGLPLSALSSGEQHEIILIGELLFNVDPGSLVLIDEPEISLHVDWQVRFIDDIRRLAEVAKVTFVVATHSPDIIGDNWDIMCSIGAK